MRWLALLLLGCSGSVEHDPAAECRPWQERTVPTADKGGSCAMVRSVPGDTPIRVRTEGDMTCEGSPCAVIVWGETITALSDPDGPEGPVSFLEVDCSAECPAAP
jgi:hypothetical protein